MGIDIYFHVERRVGMRWERAERVVEHRREPWYSSRDSTLFGILRDRADGVPSPRPGIVVRHGLPDDASEELLWTADAMECEHSTEEWCGISSRPVKELESPCGCLWGFGHTYLTVRELLAYDWWATLERDEAEFTGPISSYWEYVNVEWLAAILRMTHLAGDDLDSVRCVYWFL